MDMYWIHIFGLFQIANILLQSNRMTTDGDDDGCDNNDDDDFESKILVKEIFLAILFCSVLF